MTFIDDVLAVTAEAETPISFFRWAAICAISAVAKRKVYLQKGGAYRLYANMYVMLVARSAALRKSIAPIFAQDLVEQVGCTKVISGSNSIQAIEQELWTAKTLEDGTILSDAGAFIVSDELNTILIADQSAQSLLTKLFDSNYVDTHRHSLKGEGQRTMKGVYITMFTATNQANLEDFLDVKSVAGGFVGRTLIIYEERKSKINALVDDSPPWDKLPLIKKLKEISKYEGKFKWASDGRDLYKSWYESFQRKLEDKDDDKTGTAARIHDHILKLAMILSMAESPELTLHKRHIEEALELSGYFEGSAQRVIVGKGKSEMALKYRLLLDLLLSAEDNQLSRKRILSRSYGDFDAFDLDRMIEGLSQGDSIEVIRNSDGPQYRLNQKYVEQFKLLTQRRQTPIVKVKEG